MMNQIFSIGKCLSVDDIRSYLSGSMDESQQFSIENHLLDCPLCKNAVEGYANHYNFETDKELYYIHSAPSTLQKTAKTAAIHPVSQFNRIAATVLVFVLAGAGLLYWQNQQPERLYQAYHEPFVDETFAASRSAAGVATPAELQRAISLQQGGDFAESLPLLTAYLQKIPEHALANMLLGIAYLEDGKMEEAKEILLSVRINHDLYYEEASWYLALAYLRSDIQEEARLILQELSRQESGYYYKQANDLLDDLR